MKVGSGVILDRAAKTAKLPADANEAKACHRIVTNINDKPELHNYEETLAVKKGEYVRADDLLSVVNMEIELASAEVEGGTAESAKGDKLVMTMTTGLWKKEESVDGYAVYLEVIEKTAYRGGVLAVIRAGKSTASEAA